MRFEGLKKIETDFKPTFARLINHMRIKGPGELSKSTSFFTVFDEETGEVYKLSIGIEKSDNHDLLSRGHERLIYVEGE